MKNFRHSRSPYIDGFEATWRIHKIIACAYWAKKETRTQARSFAKGNGRFIPFVIRDVQREREHKNETITANTMQSTFNLSWSSILCFKLNYAMNLYGRYFRNGRRKQYDTAYLFLCCWLRNILPLHLLLLKVER